MAFGRKQEQIDALTAERDGLAGEVEALQQQVGELTTVGRVADRVHAELGNAATQGLLQEDAETAALIAVTAAERSRLTAELSETITTEKYDEFAVGIRIEQGPRIRADLEELFALDGTFESLQERAQKAVRAEVQAEVLQAEERRILDELHEPDAIAELRESLGNEFRASEAARIFREEEHQKIVQAVQADVEDQVRAEIEAEERGRETAVREELRVKYLATKWATSTREKARAALEETWKEATTQAVADEINDEELQKLLTIRAEMEKAQLQKEIATRKLLDDFQGLGIDTHTMQLGDVVEIYLGNLRSMTVDEKQPGTTKVVQVTKQGVYCQRKLKLLALGDGRFQVDGDSLLEATSPYERQSALHRGTVIVIGRKIVDNGQQALEPRLKADVPLYFDDDTENPAITDSLLSVANVKLNGLSAREVAKIVWAPEPINK